MHDVIALCLAAALMSIAALLWLGMSGVQYFAASFGALGALVLAMPGVDPAAGFAAFLFSNVGWLAFSAWRRHWGLFGQQVVFLITSVIGIWNWWLGPLVMGGNA